MKRFIASMLAVCILTSVLFGCGTKPDVTTGTEDGEITVAFIPKLTGSAFFDAANEGAQAFADKHGFTVEYRGSADASYTEQLRVIEEAVAAGVDAICISSLDSTKLDEALKEAMAAGIAVTTWDADVSGDARTLMVSQGTPQQLGEMLVEMGARSLEERGLNPTEDAIKYVWHYSQSSVTDQNAWHETGEQYIRDAYPNWVNVFPDNYYSGQDAARAVSVGTEILETYPDIDLIICNDSTALPGQAQAAQDAGLTEQDVSITGFAPPNAMRQYCKDGIVARWGLWDCQIQGALACYLAYYLASGHDVKVGDRINVPEIGIVEIMPNTVLSEFAYSAQNSGVALMPERIEFTAENVDNYNF